MKRQGWIVVFLILISAVAGMAQTKLTWDPNAFMGLDEITPGMKGYGKTVYEGTKIEKFEIEVIGVLEKVDFGNDMILIKVTSGPVVERKMQSVSGMSGSPIYVNDRLIGAYAYGWDFQQEPIAGVTPIAAMIETLNPEAVSSKKPLSGSLTPRGAVLNVGGRLISRVKVAPTGEAGSALQAKADPTTMVLTPVATPVFVSGMSDAAIAPLQELLKSYNVRAMAGPGRVEMDEAPKLEPGAAVAASMLQGDANISAVGTVTYVKGDTVLAFGHPFMGLGNIDMPMDVAYVHGIVNSAQSSFKMASPIKRVGTLVSDRQHAVGGVIGKDPATIPITLNLQDDSRKLRKQYRADLFTHNGLSSYIMYMLVIANGAGQLAPLDTDEGVFTADAVISTEKYGDLTQSLTAAPVVGTSFAPLGETYLLVDALMQNPYEPVTITALRFDIRHSPKRMTAVVERITPDRQVARPGDTVTLDVVVRPYGRPTETHKVSVKVPEYITDTSVNVMVVGGNHGMVVKQLVTPPAAPEEGVSGIIRWFTSTPAARDLLAVEVLPTPSYAYRGRLLKMLPEPVFDLLRSANQIKAMETGTTTSVGMAGATPDGEDRSNLRPTSYLTATTLPYVLTGAQSVTIAIDAEERTLEPSAGDYSLRVPILSQRLAESQTGGGMGDDNGGNGGDELMMRAGLPDMPWYTPQQRHRLALLADYWNGMRGVSPTTLTLPVVREHAQVPWQSLSMALGLQADKRDAVMVSIDAEPAEDEDAPELDAGMSTEPERGERGNGKQESALLSKRIYQWGIADRRSFQRGKHIGTAVTSEGRLTVVPAVRALERTTSYLPTAVTATHDGVYVTGWNTNELIRIRPDGARAVVFPASPADGEGIDAVTALAKDGDGHFLLATIPDQRVRQVSADGAVLRSWTVPGTGVWTLAVTEDGRRFAGTDVGMLYELTDDGAVRVAAEVPDRHVYSLCAAGDALYFGTAPRGKVYRLDADGTLTSVYEGVGAVSALAVDKAGNLYIGHSPSCRVVRVSADGPIVEIFRGMVRGNKHVQAMVLRGENLFVATAPAGGIYRIADPAGRKPEVTPLIAREDLRTGDEEDAVPGPESVMVNDLAPMPDGTLVAAGNLPGQVLKLEPRPRGTYLSYTLGAPQESLWGKLQLHGMLYRPDFAITVDSRSGNTAVPDQTWSAWDPVSLDNGKVTSPAGRFAQLRVRFVGDGFVAPAIDWLRLNFQPRNQAPQVRFVKPLTGEAWSGKKVLKWEARDFDGDKLTYNAFLTADGEEWLLLLPPTPAAEEAPPAPAPASEPATVKQARLRASLGNSVVPVRVEGEPVVPEPLEPAKPEIPDSKPDLTETALPIDTAQYPDGKTYQVKIIATDKYAKPDQPGFAELNSGPFIIDNTKPVIARPDEVERLEQVQTLEVTDATSMLVGGRFRIDEQEWTALVASDGIFDAGAESVRLIVLPQVKLDPGEHTVTVQVEDAAGNVAEEVFTITTPEPETEEAVALN